MRVGSMRVRISVTLPKELLARIDSVQRDRSAFVEEAVRRYLVLLERAQRNARDLEILNSYADRLNAEATDALSYQVDVATLRTAPHK